MDFIKRLFLIITLVLTTISCSHICAHEFCDLKIQPTISSIRCYEENQYGAKDNQYSINAVINSNSQIASRRNTDNQNSSSNNDDLITPKQFDNLISYIYNQTYLEDKNELALLLLLHQIQPNAP